MDFLKLYFLQSMAPHKTPVVLPLNINVKVKYNRIYSLKNENQCPFTSPNNNIIVATNRQSLNE